MKKTLHSVCITLLAFLFFTPFIAAQTPLSNDSLSLSWERLDGPAAYISKYAQHGDVLFAASEEALFTSFDGGQHWLYNAAFGRKKIRKLFANDEVVLVVTEEWKNIDPEHSFSSAYIHQIYRSIDGGFTWEKVLDLIQYPETPYFNIPFEIIAKSDTELGLNYGQYFDTGQLRHDFYHSEDTGATWTQYYPEASLCVALNDSIAFVQRVPLGSAPEGKVSGNNDLTAAKTISFSGTTATWMNLKMVAYRDGTFFLFQTDKTLWRSTDAGTNWQSDVLPISGDLMEVICSDSVFYYQSNNQVFRAPTNNPLSLSWVYGIGTTQNIKTFSPLDGGNWANTKWNQTLYSPNNPQIWEPRSAGLSSKVGTVRAECGALRAQSLGKADDEGGWYYSNQDDEDWTLPTTIMNCCPLGTFGGYVFRYVNGHLERSANCAATWQYYFLPFTAQPSGIVEHNGRLILYSSFDVVTHISDDYGDTWNIGSNPAYGITKMFSTGGYLIGIGQKIYRSADNGQSWESLDKPVNTYYFYLNNNYLVGVYNNQDEDGAVNIFRSADYGNNWEETAHFTADTCGWIWQMRAKIKAVSDSLIFVHHDDALYVSGNQGISWTRISQAPFNHRFRNYCPVYAQDTFIGQAEHYFFDSGFMYASTEAHGLWRTPLKPIHDYLYQVSAVSPQPEVNAKLLVFPNPTKSNITLRLPTNFGEASEASIRIYSDDGKLQLDKRISGFGAGNDLNIPVENWPTGMYFINIKTDKQVFQALFSKQ